MNYGKKADVFDTTLRDGSQKYLDYPTDEQAALIAVALAKLGIKDIEIGVPAAENQTVERLELIIKAVEESRENPTLYGFCRCMKSDIDAVLDKMEIAKNKGVNIVVSGSELFQILRDSELKDADWDNLTPEQISSMEKKVLDSIKTQVAYAKTLFSKVRVCFEDGSMGKGEFLLKAIRVAGESGAGVVSIPDTLGGSSPQETYELFDYLTGNTQDLQDKGMKFAIHAHDDRRLAVANSLAAIDGGARSIEGTLLGSGERVGNVNLKDVIGGIVTMAKYKGLELEGIVLERLYETYKIIHALLGKKFDPYTPYVGPFSTLTQVGIHQSLENKGSDELRNLFEKYGRVTPYSVIDTSMFGTPQLDFNVYTNLSGFSNLEKCLAPYGIFLSKNDPLVGKILAGIKPDLDNTKIVHSSRVFMEYFVQTQQMESIKSDDIVLGKKDVVINLTMLGKKIELIGNVTQKDGLLGAAVSALNEFLSPEYKISLDEYFGNMHEGVRRVAERFDKTLLPIYEKLDFGNGQEQMGISDIECRIKNNITGEKYQILSTAHDLHGNMANIKALLYGCIPLIYNKLK